MSAGHPLCDHHDDPDESSPLLDVPLADLLADDPSGDALRAPHGPDLELIAVAAAPLPEAPRDLSLPLDHAGGEASAAERRRLDARAEAASAEPMVEDLAPSEPSWDPPVTPGPDEFPVELGAGLVFEERHIEPPLSIVVPVLNEARDLDRLLQELRQSYTGAEVIVADGGSHDGSLGVVRGFPEARFVLAPAELGARLLAGGRLARSRYLLFLRPHMRLPDRAFAEVRRALAKRRHAGGYFPLVLDPPSPGWLGRRWRAWCAPSIPAADSAVAIRRETFQALVPVLARNPAHPAFPRRLPDGSRLVRLRGHVRAVRPRHHSRLAPSPFA